MKGFKKVIFLLPLLFIGMSAGAQSEIPRKVLFVGNSYTYFWDLPQVVAIMAENKGIELETHQATSGGASLGHHWRNEKGLHSIDEIKKEVYDAVIIQDHSMRAIDHPDSLIFFGELLGKLIKEHNAQSYIYMTWAREWDPNMQKTITENYIELAKKIDGQIVPVGLAWQRARELRPNLSLYDKDGSHPSPMGTYLSACVFFGILTEQSPVGLPHRLTTKDKDGEKLYLNIQSKEDALFCQKVAEEIIINFQD